MTKYVGAGWRDAVPGAGTFSLKGIEDASRLREVLPRIQRLRFYRARRSGREGYVRDPVLRRNRHSPSAVGITAHTMQSMAIKGFIVHNRETGDYALTDSGRATLLAILGDAGLT